MIQRLIDFLDESPVNYLAVQAAEKRLSQAGFVEVNPGEEMQVLQPGSKIYFKKNDSSVYALHIGRRPLQESGVHIICAHCDSPTFRIKPQAEMGVEGGMLRINTEVYGGAILSTWFDRPLSIAGRVILRGSDALHPITKTVHLRKSVMTIPNLAIHFNRQVNDGVKLNRQKDTLPLLLGYSSIRELICKEFNVCNDELLDWDLCLYDTTKAHTIGAGDELIQGGRLDDLEMVCAGLEAMMANANDIPETTRVLAIFDNEETGSQTRQGAGSPFLSNMLQRVVIRLGGTVEDYFRMVENSFMISADNAHAWHPNYNEKYDPTNHPVLGGGPVVKLNAAQKYATDARSAAVFQSICAEAGVNCQTFVNHSEVAGGSTLGNILTSSLPFLGVDMGLAIWGMHSASETGSTHDYEACVRAFTKFYKL